MVLDAKKPINADFFKKLDLLSSIDIFDTMSIKDAKNLLEVAEELTYSKG